MEKLDLSSIIKRKKEIVAADMDGETVMLSIETGKYYNLGVIGGEMWELLENSMKIEDIVNKLIQVYNVSKIKCEEEVLSFMNELLKKELIEII